MAPSWMKSPNETEVLAMLHMKSTIQSGKGVILLELAYNRDLVGVVRIGPTRNYRIGRVPKFMPVPVHIQEVHHYKSNP